ncbi:carbon-nitrogen hydrolase family protein [Gehongia tenuis]|uniref:Carbon-nitrogen hydrolase family protein n=1 Tax=Gehongia tenuis TaxID=2763655 RepID=A0A926D339_9FIRM|nr:carbon-nitrogen hydrolase family protein [Gehongia tenuis]MBC8530351.1 carbon-nitrogen hydrolase family protein [Gehongia tenuis]
MRIAVHPFASGSDMEKNLNAIRRAVQRAAAQKVRLLVFHECALCGYPPRETSVEALDRSVIAGALSQVAGLAGEYGLYIAVGSVRYEGDKRFNTLLLFDDCGDEAGCYDKTALWGWDVENFARGQNTGVFEIDGIPVGFRICFDVRFPESFRQLYQQGVKLCFVSFSDSADAPNPARYDMLKSHLVTRAAENIMTVVSTNTASGCPTAPTMVVTEDGSIAKEAPAGRSGLMIYDYTVPEPSWGTEGRRVNSDYFLDIK